MGCSPESGAALAASLPSAIRDVLATLADAGHRAWLVGGCVRDLLRGCAVADFDVASDAPPERVLALFPRAVPIGLRHGTVMLPTPGGPVDVTRLRAGPDIDSDLAHRDFTVNAMAWDPRSGRLLDPHGGSRDLGARRLRAVGDPAARLAEDPLRALRAARLAAELGIEADAPLRAALPGAGPGLAAVAPERIRGEILALLRTPDPGAGLALLCGSGLAEAVLPGARSDAAAWVAALPPDPVLRLAAWLHGAPARSLLARLRFPRRLIDAVEHLLRLHPVEQRACAGRLTSVRRLLQRAGPERVERALVLREQELAVASAPDDAARARVAALRAAVERLKSQGGLLSGRGDLALGGRDVMDLLGCGPGPRVGAALQYLTECALADPDCNTPERLRALLAAWDGHPAP